MLDESESQLLLVELENALLKYQCVVYLASITGLRNGEILALKWSDIDSMKKEVCVSRARFYVPGVGGFDKVPKTKTSKRCLSVSQVVLDKLLLLAKEQNLQKAKMGEKWQDLDYLFTSSDGHAMGCNTPSLWFRSFLKMIRTKQRQEQLAAGIPETKVKLIPLIRFHDLRHTHATLLIAEGIDILTIKNRLGHARASTTANIYCHPLKAKDVLAAELIESIQIASVNEVVKVPVVKVQVGYCIDSSV